MTDPAVARSSVPAVGYVLAFAVVSVVIIVYWPGLAGPFLFDDFGSIDKLGAYGGIDDWHTFQRFVFSGHTGPTGRPLSLLSFLIDGTNWPTDPWPFKRTNLVIHVINGLLIGAFCRKALLVMGEDGQRAFGIALVAAACWALHPFLVSTVLYPVQRMAQLAALFTIGGLNLYLWGRTRIEESPRKAYTAMSVAVGLFSVLAVLSKENGALLPLLIGVFELTVVAAAGLPKINRAWTAVFLGVPTLLVGGYLLRAGIVADLTAQLPLRGFSLYERLLTEARVVADYQRHLLLPPLFTSGVFQDGVVKSTGVLAPPSTLAAILFHATVVTAAWLFRARVPLLAFGILFFYVGHLVESTVINLELYFEHRNYLPAAFLFLPLAALAANHLPSRTAIACSVLVLALFAGFTRYSSVAWSSFDSLVVASARFSPESARAQQQYSMLLFNSGRIDEAQAVAARALERRPSSQDLNVWHAVLSCAAGRLTRSDFHAAVSAIAQQAYDPRTLRFHESLIDMIHSGACPDVAAVDLLTLYDRFLAQPINTDPTHQMHSELTYLKGIAYLLEGDVQGAGDQFSASLGSRPGVGRAMKMAALFAGTEYYDEALRFSEIALSYLRADGTMVGTQTGVTRADIEGFRDRVEAEIAARP